MQEVFIVAWRRRDGVAFGEQARLWLSMVALYIASNRKVAAVLVAYEIEGRSMPEIARMLRIRRTTAYARLQLARNRLALHAPF